MQELIAPKGAAAKISPGAAESAEDRFLLRQVEELRNQLPPFYLGMAICSLIIAGMFVERLPVSVVVFEGLFLLFAGYRAIKWLRVDPESATIPELRAEVQRTDALAGVLGIYCTLFVFRMNTIATPDQQVALMLWAAFCGIGGGMSLAVLKRACRAALILAIAPFTFYLLLTGEPSIKALAAMILLSIPLGLRQYNRMADIVFDLTAAQTVSEISRERARQTLRTFIETASDWAWERDEDGLLTYISPDIEKFLRASSGALLWRPTQAFDDLEGMAAVEGLDAVTDALRQRAPFRNLILKFTSDDGEERYMATSGQPRYAEDGRFMGHVGWASDITDRIASRRALEEANQRLEQDVSARTKALETRTALLNEVIESMADGLVVFDEDYRIVAANAKAAEISGLRPSVWAVGNDIRPVLETGVRHGLYEYDSIEAYFTDMRAKLNATGTFRALRRQKDLRIIEENVRPRPHGGYVVTYSDISDLKNRQETLEYLSVELTAAKDAAEAANRAKSEFLANMSHEIRTPLNGVIGMASLLLDTHLNARQKEMASVIVKSGDNLLTIINDILDFSRLEAGKMRIAADPFDLREIVDDVAVLLAPSIFDKGLEFTLKYDPTLGQKFIGDSGRLRQAITNLVGNAVKFTEAGRISLNVKGRRRGAFADIEILVEDTGCGIPGAKLDVIFNAFEQVDGSSARHHDGAGLGLAITRRLVEAMNGTICAESELGEGSTFRIQLPLAIDVSADDSKELAPVIPAIAGRPIRALVVDDNRVNREILIEQLTGWSMATQAFASPSEALRAARQAASVGAPFDLAILDFQMPGTDGLELGRRFRDDRALANTPLIMLTSAAWQGQHSPEIDAVFDACLTKPARAAALLDAITNAMRERASEQIRIAAEAMTSADPSPPQDTVVPETSALRVLVAEDNIVNQMVIRSMLEGLGCAVEIAENGEAACALFAQESFDIILMDISMPGMDGLEATRHIRQSEQAASGRIPIIGVTAHAMADDRDRCLKAGMDDYLAKPVKQDLLRLLIEKWKPGALPQTNVARSA